MEETGEGATKLTNSLPDEAGETDFEFWTSLIHGGADQKGGSFESLEMCVADEVFFQGQILPLWPYPYVTSIDGSRRANISNNNSSSRSSWSESSNSRRHSISANFYTHPSPKPHLPVSSIGGSFPPRRKSTSSKSIGGSSWGILQFGLVKTPALLQPQSGVGYINGSSASKRHEENDGEGKKKNNKIKRSGLIGMLINKFRRKSFPGDYSARSLSSSSSSSSSSGSLRRVHRRCHSSRTFKWFDDYF